MVTLLPKTTQAITRTLLESLRAHDPYTASHCERVGKAARQLAEVAGFSMQDQLIAEYSGYFHDIGKIGIPERVLNKPGKLDPHEEKQMQGHAAWSEHIIRPLAHLPLFDKLLMPIRHHHERPDGMGYPDRLAGEKIPVLARLIAIVDTVDAIVSDRPYRKGRPAEVAYQELFRCSGTQFDPELVQIYLRRFVRFVPAAGGQSEKEAA